MALLVCHYDSTTGGFKIQKVGSAQISDGAIISGKIADKAVTIPNIDDSDPFTIQQTTPESLKHLPYGLNYATSAILPIAVDASGYQYFCAVWPDNTVTSSKIAANAIGGVHILDGSILGADLVDNAVISGKLGSGIVGLPHLQPWASGKILVGQGTTATPITTDQLGAIAFIIDGAGAAITSGEKGHLEVPFPATINRVTLACDRSGNINLDIYKGTYAAFPPAASICSGAWPHTSGAIKYQDSILSNWVKSIASGDILAFVAKGAASSIQRCTISLGVYK